jgi:hypothetical protein
VAGAARSLGPGRRALSESAAGGAAGTARPPEKRRAMRSGSDERAACTSALTRGDGARDERGGDGDAEEALERQAAVAQPEGEQAARLAGDSVKPL